jgi:adenosylcobinamide-phosphate synthase
LSLLALLAGLLAQHAYPVAVRRRLIAFYGRMALSVAKRVDAGDRNSGLLAWAVLVAMIVGPVALLTVLAARIHPAVVWLLDVAFVYATIGFLPTVRTLASVEKALREQGAPEAANVLSLWQGEAVESDDATDIARLAAEHALREAHYGTFGPLFWFLVLPGPVGLVLYPLALRAARTWGEAAEGEPRDFGWFAARAFHVIDWIPQRLSAFAFAVVGNFEDALYCWRLQAAAWLRPEEGIVLASGAGALGVRLGEPVRARGEVLARPALGTGEPAREDALASLEGLLWRALVLWLVVFALAAALHGG